MGDCRELQIANDRAMFQPCAFVLDLCTASNNLSKGGIFDTVKF